MTTNENDRVCAATWGGEPCTNEYNGRGLCAAHAYRDRNGIDLNLPKGIRKSRKVCSGSFAGEPCGRPAASKGLCSAHARRRDAGADLDAPLIDRVQNQGVTCPEFFGDEPCGLPAQTGGMCATHYSRRLRGSKMDAGIYEKRRKFTELCPYMIGDEPCPNIGKKARGLCRLHYGRWRNGSDMNAPKQGETDWGICTGTFAGEACDRDATGPDRSCALHLGRRRNGTDPDAPLGLRLGDYGPCTSSIAGEPCDRPARSRGLCEFHTQRQRSGTEMDAPLRLPAAFTQHEAVETMRAAGAEPLEPYPGSITKPWRIQCLACGTERAPMLHNVARGTNPCKLCAAANRSDRRWIGADEATARLADIDMEPLEPYPGKLSVPWRCRCMGCGDEVEVNLHASQSNKGACRTCGYADRVIPRTLDPEIAYAEMEKAQLDPSEPYPGNVYTPWKARCRRCGFDVSPRIGSLRAGQSGCRYCGSGIGDSTHGFQGDLPSFLYLVHSIEYDAIKAGIANEHSTRLDQHAREGWQLVERWDVESGAAARRAEDVVISYWRDAGIGPINATMKQRGRTETASLDDITIDEAIQQIDAAVQSLSPDPATQ